LFEKLVIPLEARKEQKFEMKKSFYAGAVAMQQIQFMLGEKSLSEGAAIAILDGVYKECASFFESLGQ